MAKVIRRVHIRLDAEEVKRALLAKAVETIGLGYDLSAATVKLQYDESEQAFAAWIEGDLITL